MSQIPKELPSSGHITFKLEMYLNKKYQAALTALAFATGTAVGALLVTYGRNWFSGPVTLLSEQDTPMHVVKAVDEMGHRILKLETCPRDADGEFQCSKAWAVVYERFMIENNSFFFVRQCQLGKNNVFDCPEGDLDMPTQWLKKDGVCSKEPCLLDPFEETPFLGQCLPDECSPPGKWLW